ncbi:CU044_5270 family protein [Nonomuraea sp. SBT364]|uniref:CU044_5270 family protein n=1 Tax=Nonomuraea sp. SBT364 TaxID=1580530 RepID=UPI00066E06B1|nr:CU044_5270 family protein [Nonomuraea sp. SBT364]
MDDLDTSLATLLAKPEPSAEAIARSRGRLQTRTTRGRGRRRIGWLAPGLGLVAAAAAAVVLVGTGVTSPTAPASGREVLLMAAVSAERTPEASGDYWHVTRRWSDPEMPLEESWTTRDGRRWSRNGPGDPPGTVVAGRGPLTLKAAELDFEDLEALPADPEALRARIAELPEHDRDPDVPEERSPQALPLISLITELPAPAEVRSAAFRALAAMPEVSRTGTVDGGEELLITDTDGERQIRLVVDPGTARVTRTNYLHTYDGDVAGTPDGFIAISTGWTDQPPR